MALDKIEFQKKLNELRSHHIVKEYNRLKILGGVQKVYYVKDQEELLQ